jgi:hypothetical protein
MLMKKFIGKPYAGKPHVRIDEGAGKGFSPSRSTLLVKIHFFIRRSAWLCNRSGEEFPALSGRNLPE